MRVSVTQEDIAKANVEVQWGLRAMKCPIAQALNRSGNGRWVVGVSEISYTSADVRATYVLPDEAMDFIADYDEGLDVAPISFDIQAFRKAA
ncbi:hypothetical protein SEA_KEELAN_4 [Gordonia phage Keelan]|nr:hypothetical protein SEA_KEELAN_4 [Gordonia phage Keelan]